MRQKYLLFAVAIGMLTACDPLKDEGVFDITNISSEQLLNGATFEQFAEVKNEDGSVSYTPASDGNFIKYSVPSVSSVTIYYVKSDGSEFVLSKGSCAGMFNFVPSRGSDPLQTVYFRYINQNGEETVASQQFTLAVASELAPEIKLLASNDGQKVWKWNTSAPDGQIWGNMGSDGSHSGKDLALTGAGKWWGVTNSEEFLGQLNHTEDGQAHGDENTDATMVFTEDGMIYCYDASGNKIREGKYSVKDYDPTYSNTAAYCGILETDAGSILFPYEINSGGRMPTEFQIAYLSAGRLVLVYPDNGAWSGWSEGTFWQFSSTTDILGCLSDYSEATWEWDDDNGACWGNGGYGGLVYGGAGSISGNQWWGVPSSDLADQISNYGYGQNDGAGQTMTFTSEGMIRKSSGGNGGFSYDISQTGDIGGYNEGKTLGRFYTTGDGIMFPVRINAGTTTNEFDIVHISDNNFVLAYPNKLASEGGASWEEGTFWRFKKVAK